MSNFVQECLAVSTNVLHGAGVSIGVQESLAVPMSV